MFNLLDRTSSSTSVLPVLSISFSNGKGMRAAKGTFFLMSSATLRGSLSAYVAVMRKSILSVSDPIVLLMGLVGSRHLCTILVATRVSFSAFTRMFLALLTETGSSFNSICNSTGRSKLSTLCSCLAKCDKGSATVMVGPDLYRVSTIEVRSEVSCILHVESLPLLLNEEDLIPGK